MLNAIKEKLKQKDIALKQLIVGLIILLIAIGMLIYSFGEKAEPTKDNKVISQMISSSVQQNITNSAKDVQMNPQEAAAQAIERAKEIEKAVASVVLGFIAKNEKDFNYKIYYTENSADEFDENHVVIYQGRAGLNKYSIILPVKKIARLRINFADAAGAMEMKDIYLSGTQKVDLSDFTEYEYQQLSDVALTPDNGISFTAETNDPAMVYIPSLQDDK
ncbi:MAG: hypothetical protein IJ864_04610 [Alphaproteobacteria bacterium]|nr:hypothetical protein [Alphaproteobacteria bacterium]